MNRKIKLNLEAIIRQYKGIIFTTVGVLVFLILAPMFILGPSNALNPFSGNGNDGNESKTIAIKGDNKVKVYISKEKKVVEVDVEEYLIGVIGSEMPASFNEEALKAQAIAARTFYYSKRMNPCPKANGGEICDTVHCQVYVNKEDMKRKWAESSANDNYNKIKESVDSTKGLVLSFDGELVRNPQFFSTSSGKTEDAKDVFGNDIPYLKSIESPGEEVSTKFTDSKTLKISDVVTKINNAYPRAKLTSADLNKQLEIQERSNTGMVTKMKVGNEVIKGTDFRMALGLNSANYTIDINGENVKIDCKGYGHGVGMSQWGANVMGKSGKKYNEILTHYYTGVVIKTVEYKN